NGLSRFIPKTESFTNFYSSNGLPSNEFNSGGILLSRNGEIYLGTTNGLCFFHPDSIKQNNHVPEIVFTSFKIFEQEIRLDSALSEIKTIELSFKDQFFSFEFAALDFVDPLKNQYAYRLEGLNQDLIYCGKRRFVSFSHLDPGKYMFTVKGSNNAGVWNEQGTSVRLIIHPPFWRTWWAYLIYGIILIGMVVGGKWVVTNWKSIISIRARKISHYKLLALLGKGGMGEVYKAVDVITKDVVALKVLNDALLADPENKKRLSNEGMLLTSFTHPHIVRVFEVGETGAHGFIAMEYLCGGTLREYLEKNNPLPVTEVKNFLLQIGDGLGEIHKNGIIHRDLKSGNIMLDEWGKIRIMDFGLSKSPLVTTMTTMGTIIGTLGYVAPEQITGMHLDHRVDIFSYGVVVFELLTARLPFGGENEMALIHSIFNTVPPPPSALRDSISSEWDVIVKGCLEKNPEERFQSIDNVTDAIRNVDV
ncbi:MAG: protein kinase, partial [Calditrichia bacterium]